MPRALYVLALPDFDKYYGLWNNTQRRAGAWVLGGMVNTVIGWVIKPTSPWDFETAQARSCACGMCAEVWVCKLG